MPQANRPLHVCFPRNLNFSGRFQTEMPVAQHVIRIAQLASTKTKSGLLPVSPATIWRLVKKGVFPRPFKLASHTTVWYAAEVQAWIEQQKAVSK